MKKTNRMRLFDELKTVDELEQYYFENPTKENLKHLTKIKNLFFKRLNESINQDHKRHIKRQA